MKIFVFTLFILLFCTPILWAQDDTDSHNTEASHDVTYTVEDNKLVAISGETKQEIPLPGEVYSVHEFKGELYVAMGQNGVAVLSTKGNAAGTIKKIIPVSHGKVTDVVEMDGTLWMKVDSTTAIQLAQADAEGTAAAPVTIPGGPFPAAVPAQNTVQTTPAASVPESSRTDLTLSIVEKHPGKVTLNKGEGEGIRVGDRFNVYRKGQISGAGTTGFSGEEVVAVLVVEAVNDDSCLAEIWRGDRVRTSDTVRPATNEKDASYVYPRKFNGVGEVESTLRPIINIGGKGFGALCDFAVAYFTPHFFVDFRILPLGFGWTDGSKVVSNNMVLSSGYNGRAFAVGVGVGMASVNGDLSEMMSVFGGMDDAGAYDDAAEPEWEQSTKHAFSLAQRVRLGAQEGLNIVIHNTLLYYKSGPNDDNVSGFIYAGTTGRFTWPMSLRTNMFLEGGGGVMGYGFGALGVFTWVRGNGDAGSIGISASAGGAGIWGEREKEYSWGTSTEHVGIGGPMFAIGMAYRFGALD
ncbi:MAG: hypothetical protein JXX29_22565 [Deltaproteobacteria bacterium]|nr:hypothetical protein [Deltaproteobacteria bacterium]MBN2674481.1 hypothetical protein [Deltaproteobacteria bacterium]